MKLDSIKTKIYQNKHIVGDLDKFNLRLESVNSKIKELQGKVKELEELDKIIESKNKEFKELEIHNNKYLEATTLLKSSPDESKLKDDLYSIAGNINSETEKLKAFIASDSMLSLEISEETLDDLIDDLAKKDSKYHVLLGSIKLRVKRNMKIRLKPMRKRLNLRKMR